MRWNLSFVVVLVAIPWIVFAQSASFVDLLPSREEFTAVEDLYVRGIFEGRPDGTFGPDDYVNRAEAITVVVRAVANARNLPQLDGCFPDVAGENWYVQPVCYAEDLGWISGYPDGTFQPVRTVSKVEFLKILFNAYGEEIDIPSDLFDPLAPDVQNTEEWYYPFLALGIAFSMTNVDSFGNLNPGAALTRGQVALLMHRYILYREGQRTQDLLSFAEKDIRLAFQHFESLRVDRAAEATARVRLSSWGANERVPENDVILVTLKIGEALRALAGSYRLTKQGDLEPAMQTAQEAYRLADEADAINQGVTVYTNRLRSYAHDLADDIRAYQAGE